MSNADALRAIVVKLNKAHGEIIGKIDELQGLVDSGATPEDLSGPLADLAAIAAALDDVVPDAVEEEDGDEDVLDPDFGVDHPEDE